MMKPVEVPVQIDTPLYVERVTLDGKDYLLRFDWSGRENRWFLDLGTVDEIWLRKGVKIIANWPLFRTLIDARKPPGQLFAIDLSAPTGDPPEFADLGRRVKLFYFPAKA